MNIPIRLPKSLDDAARSGKEGLSLSEMPSARADLELCREWGFPLSFESGRVYLRDDGDVLVPFYIRQETSLAGWEALNLLNFLALDSTNERALQEARQGAPDGTVICSETQKAGRGRKGRSWHSPAGLGIYCTIVVRPKQPRSFWPMLTHVTSLALAVAIDEVLSVDTMRPKPVVDLKWPNDVLLSGRKTAGILLETASGNASDFAIIGVGINVRPGSVPAELASQATCLDREAGVGIPRRQVLVRFLYQFQLAYLLFERGEHHTLLERWMKRSGMVDGVPVWVDDIGGHWPAVTCGLTDLGALRVRRQDGTERILLAGDVSVRHAAQEG